MEGEKHVRGYILHRDPKSIAKALRPGKSEVPGILIHPKIAISIRQETHHFMVVGGTGAGKTTILWPWIQQAISRGDRVLIFDSKGDFTQKVPEPFTLLSPTDSRSARWVIGRDIRTPLEAQALAVTLIQEPPGGSKGDPMWMQGSRALVAGMIVDLQTRFGEKWGLDHLAYECAAALADFERLKSLTLREAPLCILLLGGEDAEGPNRTTMGFLSQIVSAFTNIIHLGVSANDMKANPDWSVREWLAGKTPNTVVIGFRGEQSLEMSQGYAASIVERVVRQIGGFPDAAPEKRRIWLCIDEAPEAGRIPSITRALTTLRSKGVRTILGFQTLASIRETYSRDTAQIWEGQTDIKIIGKLTAEADQEWASRLLGEREVDRYQHQVSQQSHSDAGGQHNASWQRVREPVLMPSGFGQEMGMQKDRRGNLLGTRALVLAGGEAAVLRWPLTPRTTLREPVVDARWIAPGYKPPAWGRDPPVVAPQIAGSLAKAGEQKTDKPKKAQEQTTTVTTVNTTQGLADLPILPGQQEPQEEQESPTDRLAGGVLEHLLDAAAPGAALAARILGLVADTASATPAGQPTQTVTVTARQGQEEREGGEEVRDE
ncbi:MAG: type IV secretion system DNA-binding domain-containing protein [Acidiferrobacter thiooxydans]